MLLAEVNQWPEDTKDYFGDGDECHMAFHFPLMPRMYMAIAREDRFPITDIMRQTPAIPENCQWAIFLRNHDELTLEMVSDSERDYLWQTYAADRRARLNLGIRRRLAPLLERDRRRFELMNSLLLSMPGTPVIYYGDEIGMGDNIHLGDRNGVRTPMQWSPDRNGGFSRADPAALVLPPIMDPLYGYGAVNVEAQTRDPHSILNWTRRMLAVRRRHPALGRGTLTFLYPKNRKVLAYLREHAGETILCVANVARSPQAVELDLSPFAGRVPVELNAGTLFPPIERLAGLAHAGAGAAAGIRDTCSPRQPRQGACDNGGSRDHARDIAAIHRQAPLVRHEGSDDRVDAYCAPHQHRRRRPRVAAGRDRGEELRRCKLLAVAIGDSLGRRIVGGIAQSAGARARAARATSRPAHRRVRSAELRASLRFLPGWERAV
jgi:hypothetical protein